MLFRSLYLLLFLAFPFSALASVVEVEISLSPVGSFTIHSDSLLGKGIKKGSVYTADKLEVPIESLKTGIDLRNQHMWKRLDKGKQFTHVTVTNVKAENGKGTAKITIAGKTKEDLEFTFKDEGNNQAEAYFKLNLKDFEIKDVSYLGVGVEDEVNLKVKVGYDVQ